MITANTIGFVLGLDNTLIFLKQVFGTWEGVSFVFQAGIGLFAAVQIMFEYRSVHSFNFDSSSLLFFSS